MSSPARPPIELDGGSWCWFADPRAIRYEHRHVRTYVGWVGLRGEVQVACYDHGRQGWAVTVVRDRLGVDDHGNPALAFSPDGRLMVFYSAHYGRRMYYRVSSAPESIDAWEPERRIPTNEFGPWGFTYPNPLSLSGEGRLYLFWRGGARNPTFAALDGEGSWSKARTLVRVRRHRPYAKFATNGVDEIHLAFTDAHPRNRATSIYYARYRDGTMLGASGREIGPVSELPLSPEQADIVHDGNQEGRAWIHDVALDREGNPALVYAVFPAHDDHRYVYARWTPSGWVTRELVGAGGSISENGSEPHYSGGIALRHGDPSMLVLSREVDGIHEVERWTTADGGKTWLREPITERSEAPNLRPVIVRNPRPGATDMFWLRGRYHSYRRYHTAIVTTVGPTDGADPPSGPP